MGRKRPHSVERSPPPPVPPDNSDNSLPPPPPPNPPGALSNAFSISTVSDFINKYIYNATGRASSPSVKNKECCPNFPSGDSGRGPPPPKDLGSVIRAPLDTKNYEVIELPNGLQVILVSTCLHELDLGDSSYGATEAERKWNKIREFNRIYLGINQHAIPKKEPTNFGCCGGDEEPPPQPTGCCSDPNCTSNAPVGPKQKRNPKVESCCRPQESGMSLVVGAGSFHDPPDIAGLAHLCEHCIFLGSKNFPQRGYLFELVHQKGGKVNAATDYEVTSYFGTCQPDGFQEMLECFSDALCNPLLDLDAIKDETLAIDCEFAMKDTCDMTRMYDFLGFLAKKCHPVGNFYWGNLKSYGKVKNIGERVRAWYKRHYAANYMTLCLQGPFEIPVLEAMAVKYFSCLPRSTEPHPRSLLAQYGDPYDETIFQKYYHLVPISNIRWMLLSWCLPKEFWYDFHTKPLHYIKVVFNHQAPGGLHDYLRRKHWVSNYYSTCSKTDSLFRNSYCSMYKFFLELTDEGLKNRDNIIYAIYSYIKMLRKAGAQWRVFEELKRTQASIFHYTNYYDVFDQSLELATTLQTVPPKYLITSKCLITKYNKSTINKILNHLDPRTANIIVIAREFAKEPNLIREQDGRFIYSKNEITPEMYKILDEIPIYPEFSLPAENTFLSKELGCPHQEEFLKLPEGKSSLKLFSSRRMKIFLKDGSTDCFTDRLPHVVWEFFLHSAKDQYHNKPKVLMWINLLKLYIWRKVNNAYDSLIQWDINRERDGLHLRVQGPSYHLTDLVILILHVVDESKHHVDILSDEKYYYDIRREMINDHENHLLDIEAFAEDIQSFLLLDKYRTIYHWIRFMREAEYADFKRFVKRYLDDLFVRIEVSGSVTQADVDTIKDVINLWPYNPYQDTLTPTVPRAVLLPKGTKILRMRANHPAYHRTVVLNHYQFHGVYQKERVQAFNLIQMVIMKASILRLRVEEHLSYQIQTLKWEEAGCLGLNIRVLTQPQRFTPEYVDERISQFLLDFYKIHFKNETTFKKLRSQYIEFKSVVPYKLAKKMYEDFLLPDGNEFRKLSLQVVGYKEKDTKIAPNRPGPNTDPDDVVKIIYDFPPNGNKKDWNYIDNIEDFKDNCELQAHHGDHEED